MNRTSGLRASIPVAGSALLLLGLLAACSNDDTSGPAGNLGLPDAADVTIASCASPGMPTPGPADTHCQGVPDQVVSTPSCTVSDPTACDDATDGGDDDDDSCDYGATMFGMEGDDDDCKYHVTWTSTPICEGNVSFTVTVVNKTTGAPVTTSRVVPGASENQLLAEAYLPTQPIPACDTMDSTHPSPTMLPYLTETSATSGVYTGVVAFDTPGEWTVRFHIQEQCDDICDDSPHGHAAFHVTVP
jgi:hypothetical protein